jgi:hypothetical protein
MAKKKKQQDFAKVKLKVGKKLTPTNATNTEFKAKKVVIKSSPGLVSNPVHSLTTCITASPAIKIVHLSKFLTCPMLTSPHLITGDLLNALARLSLDPDDKVRRQARQCVEQSLNCMLNKKLSLQNSIPILLTHVKCGLTHFNQAIANDSRKLLSFLITRSTPDQEQAFMDIVKSRIWDGKSVSLLDLELAAEIVTKFHHKPAAVFQKQVLEWSPVNNHIPWSKIHSPLLSESVDVTFSGLPPASNTHKDLTQLLQSITSDGIAEFTKRSSDSRACTLTFDTGRRLVALLKLARSLHPDLMASLTLPEYEVTGDGNKKKPAAAVTRQIKDLISETQ